MNAPDDFERQPPQDIQAEQATLGAMLLSESQRSKVLDILTAHDFYKPAHTTIYLAIEKLYTTGAPVDAVAVGAELMKNGDLIRVGGAPYLHTLIRSVPTAANGGYYADIVKDKAVLRRLAEAGTRMVQMAHETDGSDVAAIVESAGKEWEAVRDAAADSAGSATVLDDVCPKLGPYLDGTFTAPTPTIGQREDGPPLFYPGQINRVFGKSESGKTWLVLLAGLQHMRSGGHFVFCDYENGAAAVIPRMLALGATPDLIQSGRFRYLDLRDAELTAARRAAIVSAHPAAVVAVDSVAGLVASNAKSSNYVDDVESLMTRDMAVFTRAECCVVFIDHETDRDGGDGRSTGSHRKKDLISGVSLRVQSVTPFRPHGPEPVPNGRSRVWVDKDRHGGVRAVSVRASGDRDHFADLTGHPHPDGRLTLKLWPPDTTGCAPDEPGTDKRPPLARKIITVLGAALEPLDIKTLITEIGKINEGKEPDRTGVSRTLNDLLRQGAVIKASRPGTPAVHWSLNTTSEEV